MQSCRAAGVGERSYSLWGARRCEAVRVMPLIWINSTFRAVEQSEEQWPLQVQPPERHQVPGGLPDAHARGAGDGAGAERGPLQEGQGRKGPLGERAPPHPLCNGCGKSRI